MFFVLPIYLVAARLVTATAFPALLALWTQTAEGAAALELVGAPARRVGRGGHGRMRGALGAGCWVI